MIECYLACCANHECNTPGGVDGPFCAESQCLYPLKTANLIASLSAGNRGDTWWRVELTTGSGMNVKVIVRADTTANIYERVAKASPGITIMSIQLRDMGQVTSADPRLDMEISKCS